MVARASARRRGLAILLPLALAACATAAPSPHTTIAGNASVLRQAYNADTGKVRANFLASPT